MLSSKGNTAAAVWRCIHFLRPRPALAFPFPLRPAGATAAAAVASAAGAAAGAATARRPAQASERSVMLGLSAKAGMSATMPRLRGRRGSGQLEDGDPRRTVSQWAAQKLTRGAPPSALPLCNPTQPPLPQRSC